MIIAVLVVIWIVALTPAVVRRLSDRYANGSVERFHYRTWLAQRAYPAFGASPSVAPIPIHRGRRIDPEMQLRLERLRIRRRRERRRRVLVAFAGTILGSFVLGAIPPLRALWDLSLVSFLFGSGYVVALTSIARNEALSLERLRLATAPAPTGPVDGRERRDLAVANGGRVLLAATPMQPRPAFNLVEAPVG